MDGGVGPGIVQGGKLGLAAQQVGAGDGEAGDVNTDLACRRALRRQAGQGFAVFLIFLQISTSALFSSPGESSSSGRAGSWAAW